MLITLYIVRLSSQSRWRSVWNALIGAIVGLGDQPISPTFSGHHLPSNYGSTPSGERVGEQGSVWSSKSNNGSRHFLYPRFRVHPRERTAWLAGSRREWLEFDCSEHQMESLLTKTKVRRSHQVTRYEVSAHEFAVSVAER